MIAKIAVPAEDRAAGTLTWDLVQDAAELFRTNGYVLLENAFEPDFLQSLLEDYTQRYLTLGHDGLRKGSLRVGDKRLMVTLAIEGVWNTPELYGNGIVLPVVKELLEWDCVLNGVGSVVAFPGADFQKPHRDYPYLFGDERSSGLLPPYAVTVFVPLMDLTRETGTTIISEGSHRKNTVTPQNWFEESQMRLPFTKLGSCYLVDYRTMHAGTPNNSQLDRPIMYLIYSRAWFRDSHNYKEQEPLIITEDDYAQVPEGHRSLFALAPVANNKSPAPSQRY